MKSRFPSKIMVAMAAMALGGRIMAQTNAPTQVSPGSAAAAVTGETPPVLLSNGVPDILKLVRAKVSEEVITAFIKGSGRIYRLSVPEILYLREQGVPDPSLTAMLESQKNVAAASLVVIPPAPAASATLMNQQPAQSVTQAASTYATAVPVYVEPSPVYVYPSSSYYYSSWPHYGGYRGYPGVSLSFGFGSGYYGGYYGGYSRGPYRGYSGGSYHGGGHPPAGGHPPGGRPPGGQPPAGRPSGGGAHK